MRRGYLPSSKMDFRNLCVSIGCSLLLAVMLCITPRFAQAATKLASFLADVPASDLVPGATRYGAPEGSPLAAPAYRGDELLGYVFLNSDAVNSIGYSGKPIHILVGLQPSGIITGVRLVKHHEPIVLIGIPEAKIRHFIDGYVGANVLELLSPERRDKPPVDIISGATVTVLVIHDTIIRSAIKVIRARGLAGVVADDARDKVPPRTIDMAKTEVASWQDLLSNGAVRRLSLSVADINAAFAKAGPQAAIERPEDGPDTDTFIDMYAATVSVPSIGRSLLGDAEYELLKARLKPGQGALLFAGNGRYSFKGSSYVRGGLFDRIHVVQGDESLRFHDRNHKRIGEILADGAPRFTEIALFMVPETLTFNPAMPWRVELLTARAIGAVKKAYLSFSLPYQLAEHYLEPKAAKPVVIPLLGDDEAPLWERIWRDRVVDIVIMSTAIIALTGIFFFQNILVRHRVWMGRIRNGFLIFTVVWIGGYAQAQLSVVNILTFFNSLITGFQWEYFLMDPMLFILWASVAASLLFWGRGAYCGWLCPFGALQELLNKAAKHFKVPQYAVPWGLHERLWSIKYMIFLPLFGLSIYSFALAETVAEVEPFKTAIVLRFAREWPFVLYALTLLAAGLFVERFFCRYLCPLGAGLAIPGRIRMFDWLKRYKECGSPCLRCARECMVQAIHPEGMINPNECLSCLHCQEVYYDDTQCPPMIQRRLRLERRAALSEQP